MVTFDGDRRPAAAAARAKLRVSRETRPAGARGGRRERKKREVYRRICDAAADLFRERGYENTTMGEIADRADVAKGTVFNHFARKEALLTPLAEALIEQLARKLGPIDRWDGTGADKLRRLFLTMAELADADRELSRVVLFENMRNLWSRSREEAAIRELRDLVRQVLAGAARQGEFRPDVDVETVARLLESIYFTTLVEWLSENTAGSAFRRELNAKLDIVFRGLAREIPDGREEGR
jgi:AcrR family transcriptional regulator